MAHTRFKSAVRFEIELTELKRRDPLLHTRCHRAIDRLIEAPEGAGSHLEKVRGQEGVFTARVDRNHRLLLVEREDDEGTFLLIVRVAAHDEAY